MNTSTAVLPGSVRLTGKGRPGLSRNILRAEWYTREMSYFIGGTPKGVDIQLSDRTWITSGQELFPTRLRVTLPSGESINMVRRDGGELVTEHTGELILPAGKGIMPDELGSNSYWENLLAKKQFAVAV